MDHTLDQAQKAKGKLEATEKAHAKVDKKLNETLAQLTDEKKAQRNVEATLNSFEKQALESLRLKRRWKTSWP